MGAKRKVAHFFMWATTPNLIRLSEQVMNLLYNKLTDTNQNIFDLGVYKGDNSSLRLPLCYKINKQNKLDKRPFIIGENSQFKNFVISDISTCTLMFNNLIHLDTAFPIDPAHFVDKYSKL